jgi:hypothetical protein
MISRRHFLITASSVVALPAYAHHGWRWTDGGDFELRGRVTEARLGNPHGVLTMDVNGEAWTVEVGQPWRNERAGLTDAMLQPGAELTILGERAADDADLRVKAEVVVIGGQEFVLYPDRV